MISSLELARICGVSQGTVDRFLHNRGRVSEPTRAAVLAAAARHGYLPNPAARELMTGRSRLIAAIAPSFRSVFFMDIMDALNAALRSEGLELILSTAGNAGEADVLIREFAARRVLLAIGRRGSPRRLEIPGEERPHVAYQLRDAEAYAGSRALVVGGGDSAIEAALQLAWTADATRLAYRGAAFHRAKADNRRRLESAVAEGRIELLLEAEPREIHADAVSLATPSGERRVDADAVFVLVGGVLPTALLRGAGNEIDTHFGEARR